MARLVYVLQDWPWTAIAWVMALLTLMMSALCFTSAGVTALLSLAGQRVTVLDKRKGRMWQEAGQGGSAYPLCERRISDIVAVQVSNVTAGEVVTRLELNLVFSNPPGDRLNLMSHGKSEALLADAKALAAFLEVPLLDQSDRIEIMFESGRNMKQKPHPQHERVR